MAGKTLRGAIVGAADLLGKELAEELKDSEWATWDLTLLDGAETGGQITSVDDEAMLIQPVTAGGFEGVDVVFFAGELATTRDYWEAAHAAGASIVDLTGGLEGLPGVLVRSAWVEGSLRPDLATVAVVAAHPMAAALALITTRLRPLGLRQLAATVLMPASELGSAGVDELHQQTVGLLAFQPLQKEVYDAQVAFSLRVELGGASKVDLERVRSVILRQASLLTGGEGSLAIQIVQAPVFHGYAASVFVQMEDAVDEGTVRTALHGDLLQVSSEGDGSPSNESAAGTGEMLLNVRSEGVGVGSGFWVWLVGDNLRLAVRNAAGCARELVALRPASGVN